MRLYDGCFAVELDAPCQVKQSEVVGRKGVDNFETAIHRADKDRGVIIAFSFGKGAYEEVPRAKNEMNLEIRLKKVEEILKETWPMTRQLTPRRMTL